MGEFYNKKGARRTQAPSRFDTVFYLTRVNTKGLAPWFLPSLYMAQSSVMWSASFQVMVMACICMSLADPMPAVPFMANTRESPELFMRLILGWLPSEQ